MTQLAPARARFCPNCDGFPRVHIDTGTRHADGSRTTVPVDCRTCHGTGTLTTPARTTITVGR